MKLLTHNILRSNVKGAKTGYPLRINVVKVNLLDVGYNEDFIKNIMDRINYNILRQAAIAVSIIVFFHSMRHFVGVLFRNPLV